MNRTPIYMYVHMYIYVCVYVCMYEVIHCLLSDITNVDRMVSAGSGAYCPNHAHLYHT
jgi:hypothetical protein